MVEAGQIYNTEVSRQKKGHGLGAPFPHAALATLEAATKTEGLEPQVLAILQACSSERAKGQSQTAEIFGTCKAEVTAQGKSEQEGKAVVKLALKPYALLRKPDGSGY
eukprot:2938283-Pyramimonas_sp.AAC.1